MELCRALDASELKLWKIANCTFCAMATPWTIFNAADAADQAFEVLRQTLQAHEQNGCDDGELSHMQCPLRNS